MTSIELITQLDELRAKATQGEWRIDDEDGNLICNDDVLSVDMRQSDINYIAEMHNALPTLRQAVLERDRYKAAGEYVSKALENAHSELPKIGYWTRVKNAAVLAAYQRIATGVEPQPSAYRTAIDDSSK